MKIKIKLKDINMFNETLVRKGFTKTAFSKEVGISAALAINLCNGKRIYFSPAIAAKTVEKLEVGFDDLFKIVK